MCKNTNQRETHLSKNVMNRIHGVSKEVAIPRQISVLTTTSMRPFILQKPFPSDIFLSPNPLDCIYIFWARFYARDLPLEIAS